LTHVPIYGVADYENPSKSMQNIHGWWWPLFSECSKQKVQNDVLSLIPFPIVHFNPYQGIDPTFQPFI
jgi:hypothetical protein